MTKPKQCFGCECSEDHVTLHPYGIGRNRYYLCDLCEEEAAVLVSDYSKYEAKP